MRLQNAYYIVPISTFERGEGAKNMRYVSLSLFIIIIHIVLPTGYNSTIVYTQR